MNSDAKNMTNYLVESETLPMFALQNRRYYVKTRSYNTQSLILKRCPMSASTDVVASVLQNLTGQRLFCCSKIFNKLLTTKCRTELKARQPRIIVTAVHPFASTVNYSVISVPYRQCARLTNRNYPTKPTKYRYARLLRRRLTVLKKTLNLQTYTRLRTRYMRSAGLWRILTLVSSTYRSILNQLESLFDREPLLMPI